MVLYQLWRGFHFLDALLCSSFIFREHFEIQSVVLSPSVKSEKKVRTILEGLCGSSNSILSNSSTWSSA
ncbi:hypothetical protein L1987_47496 [Smallanthus sonchifolius]|uniref:Uncharacterized protein n=1 Tax=Smallanthus sonchifolius TaxID=185202 RepID=A0ACB9G3P4_9ASTR|nr:hypothetical protein L1987_47496 [Smallanthus sonchifolius]